MPPSSDDMKRARDIFSAIQIPKDTELRYVAATKVIAHALQAERKRVLENILLHADLLASRFDRVRYDIEKAHPRLASEMNEDFNEWRQKRKESLGKEAAEPRPNGLEGREKK